MTLFATIKKSIKCVLKNPVIALFFVLFLIAVQFIGASLIRINSKSIAQITMLCLFALTCVFISGWFKVIKESIDIEKIKEKNFYALFLEGVGENVISILIGLIIYSVGLYAVLFISQYIAFRIFGSFDAINQNSTNIFELYNSLSDEQKDIVAGWGICNLCGVSLFNLASLFYFPALLNDKKNKLFLKPLIAVWTNLVFMFKNFFNVIAIGLLMFLVNFILAVLNTAFESNRILSLVFLLVYIYFIAISVMLIFGYYEEKNNDFDRSYRIGEDETVDTTGKED